MTSVMQNHSEEALKSRTEGALTQLLPHPALFALLHPPLGPLALLEAPRVDVPHVVAPAPLEDLPTATVYH